MTAPIQWNHDPEPESKSPKLKLLRCPQGSLPPFVILSPSQFGGDSHYYGGRTIPCEGRECPYCAVHSKRIWKGYLAVWDAKHRTTGIIEFTKPCLETIRTYKAAHGTLRTHSIELHRAGKKINGSLSVILAPTAWADADIPPPPDVIAILTRMWNQRPETILKPQPPNTEIVMEPPQDTAPTIPLTNRFTTEGNPTTKIYETTPEQRIMLATHRALAETHAKKNGAPH
jgi:hypothetical protein